MMPKRMYTIIGLGFGLDGLIAESTDDDHEVNDLLDARMASVREITRLRSPSVVVGDRNVSYPIRENSLWINREFLEPYDLPIREYASDNPWGKYKFEGRCETGNLEVTYAQYERCLQVTVTEKANARHKTLYATNYFNPEAFREVKNAIEQMIDRDSDDLIFKLQELKNGEVS